MIFHALFHSLEDTKICTGHGTHDRWIQFHSLLVLLVFGWLHKAGRGTEGGSKRQKRPLGFVMVGAGPMAVREELHGLRTYQDV
jgi:hypothetical protein